MGEPLGNRSMRSTLRHDLRTPLGHIVGYAEMLLEEAMPEPQVGWQHALVGLRREAQAALAQTDAHFAALAPGEDPALEVLAQTLALHRSGMAARLGELHGMPPALAEDIGHIEEALRNLARLLAIRAAGDQPDSAGR